jgi:hypothetical protein
VPLPLRPFWTELDGADRRRHIAITGVHDALQETGNLLEERISVLHRQRPGCGEDRGNLTVGQSERQHVAESAGVRRRPQPR